MPWESTEQLSFIIMKEATSIHRRPDLKVSKTLNLSCLTGFQALLGFWLFTSDEHPWHSSTKKQKETLNMSYHMYHEIIVSLSKSPTNPTMPRAEGHGWHHPNSRLAWSLAPRQVLSLRDSSYWKNIVFMSLQKAETWGGICLWTWDQNIKICVKSKWRCLNSGRARPQKSTFDIRFVRCGSVHTLESFRIQCQFAGPWVEERDELTMPNSFDVLFNILSLPASGICFSSVGLMILMETKEKTSRWWCVIPSP
jgi:hypothetical protein